jgi:hypothetical protein
MKASPVVRSAVLAAVAVGALVLTGAGAAVATGSGGRAAAAPPTTAMPESGATAALTSRSAATPTPAPPTAPPPPTDPGPPPSPMVGGYDVSWTQCPVEQGGYGNPMPRPGANFVVIGVSKGSAFTTNPCLADQVAWARSRHVYVAAYVFPTYPTNAEYARYGAKGPYSTKTVQGRLMNVGWQQATYWAAAKKRAGLTTPMVWVDVEQKRTLLRWTARPADRNLPVLRGLLAGLKHAGLRTGIYTTTAHWKEITGGVRLGLPEWRTVGPATARDAFATCGAPGVQGSPVLLAQYYTNLPAQNYDYDVMCPVTRTGGRLTRYFTKY